ncbi:MAG TPA: lamin tail domain-containing protein, partial [Verrucomicrobiae bacterium]|nr:lamin tail domain-containing protein [Verrucomicrobiae bacterium]
MAGPPGVWRILLAAGLVLLGCPVFATDGLLDPARFVHITQSSDATSANIAARAMDGTSATFSLTADEPGSHWRAELGRHYLLHSVQVVNRAAPNDRELAGLALRLFNLDDQVVFQTTLTNPGAGGTWAVDLPAGLHARSVWIGLTGDQTNSAGNHRVGLAEVRLLGELKMPFGPEPPATATSPVKVYQSSDYDSSYPAVNAVDGDIHSFSHTANLVNSYWMVDWGAATNVDRLELVNRLDCCGARLGGLIVRLFDGASNSVFSAVLPNPGEGGLWATNLPAGTSGRYLRVGLEGSKKNADGNYYVSLAEARVIAKGTNLLARAPVAATDNLAAFKKSYMVRLTEAIPPASRANDNDVSTETKTTTLTVDGYWETDLGGTFALYGVRVIGASGIGNRLTNTVLRLFNNAHDSVYARKLTGTPDVFDCDLDGPVFARYVRVGLEDKQRTDPAGNLEWYIGMREVEVFGRPTNEVGVLSFSASSPRVDPGQPVTLHWNIAEARRAEIHPAIGSVGANTLPAGTGTLTLTPQHSTEYILIASNAAGLFHQAVTVETGVAPLPVQISEVVTENKESLRDGFGDAPDWIELRNPGNTAVNLAGFGLSDDPKKPMKWVFPAVQIAAHGTLIVFASGKAGDFDPAGFLHASFRLDKSGETMTLTAPGGLVLDTVAVPALDTDLSYGRDLEGAWTFMETTPGALNTGATYAGWLRPLVFSQAHGFYDVPFTLTVNNPNEGAEVFYSLDGTGPSLPYTTGIQVTGTKAIRAAAKRAGHRPARIQTATYVFLNDVIASPLMRTSVTRDPKYSAR